MAAHGRGPMSIAISTDTRGVDIKPREAAAHMPRLLSQCSIDCQSSGKLAMSGYSATHSQFLYFNNYFYILFNTH